MPFNSLPFVFFFIIVIIFTYSIKTSYRTSCLLAASYFFYTYAGFSSVFYLGLITFVTYTASRAMDIFDRKTICIIGISIITTLLVSAKYSNLPQLINESFFSITEYSLYNIPIGISFYALQAIGLLIDIRKERIKVKPNLKETALFISFFPLSLAGPIHRAKELIPQFKEMRRLQLDSLAVGIKTLLFGFFCKLIVADKLALLIDPVFNDVQQHNGLLIYLITVLYSLQIYFDFWGYSLIAIGIGKCLGYEIKVNFNNPYNSASFKEFWHRWHITLSQWMRDYIYIPIGGNRHGYATFTLAISMTFLLSGAWHGLTINFLLWGITHMLLFIIDDMLTKNNKIKSFPYLRRLLFISTVPFTWLIFRTNSFIELYNAIEIIFRLDSWSLSNTTLYLSSCKNMIYITTSCFVTIIAHSDFIIKRLNSTPTSLKEKFFDSIFLTTCLLSIIFFGDIGTQQFLYFNF